MKLILIIFSLFVGTISFSQKYHCTFQVQDVETYSIAKPLISIIRSKYNTESTPSAVFVKFDEQTKKFSVDSEMSLSQEQIAALMNEYSYTISGFSSSVLTTKENGTHE